MTLFGNCIENEEDIRNNLTTKLTVLLAFNTFNKPFNVWQSCIRPPSSIFPNIYRIYGVVLKNQKKIVLKASELNKCSKHNVKRDVLARWKITQL